MDYYSLSAKSRQSLFRYQGRWKTLCIINLLLGQLGLYSNHPQGPLLQLLHAHGPGGGPEVERAWVRPDRPHGVIIRNFVRCEAPYTSSPVSRHSSTTVSNTSSFGRR
jgi:hypothetical protein